MSDKTPLPKKAWALVHYGPDGHLLEFANGFGIYPTRQEADEVAAVYQHAYKVVRVKIAFASPSK